MQGFGKDCGQSGDARRADDAELDPTPEEAAQPTVALAQEDIIAACLWIENCNLGKREGAQEGEQTRQYPDGSDQAEVGDVLGYCLRFLEDAGADNGADDDGGSHQRT